MLGAKVKLEYFKLTCERVKHILLLFLIYIQTCTAKLLYKRNITLVDMRHGKTICSGTNNSLMRPKPGR